MTLLEWIADHSFIIAVLAAAVGITLKFETRIPEKFKRPLFVADIVIIVSTLLLGILKEQLDQKWKAQIAQELSAASDAEPRKQMISTVTAYAFLEVRGTKILQPRPADSYYSWGSLDAGKLEDVTHNQWKIHLSGSKPSVFTGGDGMTVALEFQMDPNAPLWNASKDFASALKDWDVVCIHAGFLDTNCEILGGWAIVTVNSTFSKRWEFPHQKPFLPEFISASSNGGFSTIALGQGGYGSTIPKTQ